jgi:protease I
MAQSLNGKKVAILVTDGFEQVEMTEPRQALDQAGAQTHLIAPREGKVKGWNHTEWGDQFNVDVPLDGARPQDYEALLLPGGVMNPDKLRMDGRAVEFARHFVESGKPVAVICHGPWTLIEAGVVRGRRMTSYGSLKTDLRNAGAEWVDEPVVVDRGLVSSRKPDDLRPFIARMLEEFREGAHEQRPAA